MIYLIDANVLITAHNDYYAIDSVPEFWTWLTHHANQGVIKMPIEIFDEIKLGGKDEQKDLLYKWLTEPQVKKALVFSEEVDPALVATCTIKGYAPDLTDTELLQVGRDPFLIAYAMASPKDRCVISNEVAAPKRTRQNRKIPDVCKSLGVECYNVFHMTRNLGFKTNWKR